MTDCDMSFPRTPAIAMTPEQPRRRRYSSDLLERTIYQYHTLHHSTKEISEQLNISQRVVQRTLRLWRVMGRVRLPNGPIHRPRATVLSGQRAQVGYIASTKHEGSLLLSLSWGFLNVTLTCTWMKLWSNCTSNTTWMSQCQQCGEH